MAGEDRKWSTFIFVDSWNSTLAVIIYERICSLYSSKKPTQQDRRSNPVTLPHRAHGAHCAFCDLLIHNPTLVVATGGVLFPLCTFYALPNAYFFKPYETRPTISATMIFL